ncbi:MAG: spore germination protein, partial [Clostridia bacterium]|nr:spore germination protein [Clostridia bacterium]
MPNKYSELTAGIDLRLSPQKSFDIIKRELIIGGKSAAIYFVDGFIKDEIFERILEFMLKITPEQLSSTETAKEFSERFLPYVEVDESDDIDTVCTAILSGATVLLIDSVEGYL